MKEKILEVVDLCKEYPVKRGALLPKEIGMVHAVNHVSFTLYQGRNTGDHRGNQGVEKQP